jgi:L-ascorbate metabolism protein UlaG (beta-lactamase superfamily)
LGIYIFMDVKLSYVGGPTALLAVNGVRFLTDPTFDAAPAEYSNGPVTLRKLAGPMRKADTLLPVLAVLLSHDHHFDNLDRSGREFLARAVIQKTFAGEGLQRRLRLDRRRVARRSATRCYHSGAL